MGPIRATVSCMSQPFTFSGRASRSEYWWFTLMTGILWIVLLAVLLMASAFFLGGVEGGNPPAGGGALAMGAVLLSCWPIFAQVSVTVRRLHDTDRSGWWFWIQMVPLVGYIILLLFLVGAGDHGRNAYGSPTGGAKPKVKAAKAKAVPKGLPGEPYNPINELTTTEELRALRASRMAS